MDMVVEHRAALDLIFPLADALQIKLFYNVTEKGARIRGSEKMNFPIDSNGESLPFELKVHASAVGVDESWLLARVRGELWILLGYLKQGSELQLCIVDSHKGHFGPVTTVEWSGLPFSKVAEKLFVGIVASFYRNKDESDWRRLDVCVY